MQNSEIAKLSTDCEYNYNFFSSTCNRLNGKLVSIDKTIVFINGLLFTAPKFYLFDLISTRAVDDISY